VGRGNRATDPVRTGAVLNNILRAIGIQHEKHRECAVAVGKAVGLHCDWPSLHRWRVGEECGNLSLGVSNEPSTTPELDRLRASGRRSIAEQGEQVHRRAEREAALVTGWERLGRFAWGNHPKALRTAFRYYATRVAYGSLVVAVTLAIARVVFSDPELERTGLGVAAMMTFPGWFFVVALVLAPIHRTMVELQVRAEKAWLASLPFETQGYLETLSHFPRSNSMRVRVWLVPVDPTRAAPEDVVRDLAGLVRSPSGELPTVHHDGNRGEASFASPQIAVKFPSARGGSHKQMSGVRSWQRRVLSQIVVPLHRTHPIERVTIHRIGG
jgi:hypothetical protein